MHLRPLLVYCASKDFDSNPVIMWHEKCSLTGWSVSIVGVPKSGPVPESECVGVLCWSCSSTLLETISHFSPSSVFPSRGISEHISTCRSNLAALFRTSKSELPMIPLKMLTTILHQYPKLGELHYEELTIDQVFIEDHWYNISAFLEDAVQ